MPRYIDADELLRKPPDIHDYYDESGEKDCAHGYTIATIKSAPTLTPDEVRGVGEWISLDIHKGMEQYKCSVCETPTYVPECMNNPMYGYCPNCGARLGNGGTDDS